MHYNSALTITTNDRSEPNLSSDKSLRILKNHQLVK